MQCQIMPLHDLLNSLAGLCDAVMIQNTAKQFVTELLQRRKKAIPILAQKSPPGYWL